ncbi:hypothetical protein ABIC89_005533 [Variovorax boronicumulans]
MRPHRACAGAEREQSESEQGWQCVSHDDSFGVGETQK